MKSVGDKHARWKWHFLRLSRLWLAHNRVSGRQGYIIVSVLSVLGMITGIIAIMLITSRTSIDTTRVTSKAFSESIAIQSALTVAAYHLIVLGMPEDQVNGSEIRLDRSVVSLGVGTEAGKVDLNNSGRDLLAAAYRASGLSGMDSEEFAARVLEWRGYNDVSIQDKANALAHANESFPYTTGNGQFRTVDDLVWIPGIVIADLERFRPLMTVFNPSGRISPFTAIPELIQALPGVSKATGDKILSMRRKRDAETEAAIADLLLIQAAMIDVGRPKVFRIDMTVRLYATGRSHCATAVIAPAATDLSPFQVLDWHAADDLMVCR